MIYVYNGNGKFSKQIEYVFNNIFFILGLRFKFVESYGFLKEADRDDILISYDYNICDSTFGNVILIKPSGLLFSDEYLKKSSIPEDIKIITLEQPLKDIDKIISIYNSPGDLFICKVFNDKRIIQTNIDFISDIFFMLTRYEEIVNKEATEHEIYNRFPAKESLAYKNGFLDRPIANEHIEHIWSWIEEFDLGYKRKNWWVNKSFAVCLSHDVDVILRYKSLRSTVRTAMSLLIKHKQPVRAHKLVNEHFKTITNYKNDPIWSFDYILDIEKKYGFTSSFYFMNGGTSNADNFYHIDDIRVLKLIKQIEESGCEAGYHASFNSYNNYDQMKKEKIELDAIIENYGCRQHFLRFQAPFTWRHQEKVGLLYDTTLSYADCEGFRCGICFPYKPYDLLEDRVLDIWEIPLIVMEGSLQSSRYRGFTPEEGLKKTIDLIDTVKKFNGVFTLLWHNSSFDRCEDSWNGWKRIYEDIMIYLGDNSCLGTSGREIIKLISSKN